jgi:long-chain fatty acid transport protein
MKRLNLFAIGMLMLTPVMYAGGLKTNVNQSAAWVRTLSRDATLGVDGVYFNPAGLAHLNNGLHFSLNNQSIFQTRTITSDYMFLTGTPKTYEADLVAPFFPNIYAAYKMDKWTFSGGFNIIGGGGSADFPNGIPDFEVPVASIPAMLEGLIGPNPPIEGYNMASFFTGSSAYMGYQLGATYAINDMFSVAFTGRLVTAKNNYEGSLTDVTLNVPAFGTDPVTPGNYLRGVASMVPPDAPGYDQIVGGLNGAAGLFDASTSDKYLNATQTGTGFTPIFSVNIHPSDMLNIAVRYEHRTKIELTNDTEVDDVGMFPDGEKVRADLPGMFAVGARVKPIEKLAITAGFNYFLDKSAYYGNVDATGEQIDNETTIDENGFTYSFSLEYKFLGILGVSAGYTSGNNGVNDSYQSNITQGLKSRTFGGGVFVDVGEKVTINAGVSFTSYDDYDQAKSYALSETAVVPYTDTYGKKTTIFAIGVDFSF